MIPNDIVDRVLGVLHSEKDYATLETCSLVFPQFVDRHLYSQITLDVLGQGLRVVPCFYPTPEPAYYVVDQTKFSRLLIDCPHVANYVRVVQIVINITTTQLQTLLGYQQLGDRLSSTSSILATLPHPEMIMADVRGYQILWHLLGPKFCSAFLNSIQLPSIISIAISNISDFPLDYFDNCKNLKNLHLGGLFTRGETVSTSPYPRLRSFRVDSDRASARMVSWMKSTTLHTLSLGPHTSSSLPKFQMLIKACSTTLVNLEIDHNFYALRNGRLPITFPDLHLPCLDHLTVRSPLDGQHFMHISPPSLLIPFLGSIKSLSFLSPIYLTLELDLLLNNDDDLGWFLIMPVLILPIFRHPIELCFTRAPAGLNVVSLLQKNSDIRRLQEDGRLVAFIK